MVTHSGAQQDECRMLVIYDEAIEILKKLYPSQVLDRIDDVLCADDVALT